MVSNSQRSGLRTFQRPPACITQRRPSGSLSWVMVGELCTRMCPRVKRMVVLPIDFLTWFFLSCSFTIHFFYKNVAVKLSFHALLFLPCYVSHCHNTLQPTSSSVGLRVFYPRESKCKWWNRNFINNWTPLLLLFILFHNCWNLQECWMYGCAFENVFTTSFSITYTTCHLQGMKESTRLH